MEARDDAREAREKLLDQIKITSTDTAKIEWLWKEHDDMQQWINLLEGEL